MSRNNITSFWQSPLWSEILLSTQQADVIPYIFEGSNFFLERRKIFGPFTGLYILGIERDTLTTEHLQYIRSLAQKNDLFVQVEPIELTQEKREERKEKRERVKRAPFRRFIEPVTALLRLQNASEESLLQSFKEKGRYNIRLAERRGLATQWVRGDEISIYTLAGKNNESQKQTYAEIFFQLLEETTDRDGFAHNSLAYYQHFLRILEKYQAGGLLIAIQGNTIHAAGIFVYWDHYAIYYYGASSSDSEIRRDKGTHLLQWDAIKEAMHRQCYDYDFLGISSREGDKLAGVTQFKMQFNPEKVLLPAETVIVLRPFLLKILQGISYGRKIIRKLLK